jgi:ABC-2 type transport system ATP-binding protein
MTVMNFDNVIRAYERGHNVLNGVSFSVNQGDVVGLLGRNGAGKTTLVRLAMGMIAPQHGDISLFEQDPRKDPVEIKRRVGYVSEDQILPGFLTIGQVVDLHRTLYSDWDDLMAEGLLSRYQLDPDKKIKTLSKGQARQVALMSAVCHKPELLILDEPAGGLDPAARRDFLETSIQLLNESGSTILFSSHHMSDVERMAGRVVMLHDGKVLIDDPLDNLRESVTLLIAPHSEGQPNGKHDALADHADVIAVRDRLDGWHALVRRPPAGAMDVARELHIEGAQTTVLGLEELFIELAEGQS